MSAIWEVVPGWGSTDIGPYWKVLRWKTQYSHNIQCLSQYSHNIRQNVCHNVPIISKTHEFVATGWLNVGIGFCTFWREHALRLDWSTSMFSHSAEMFQLKLNFHMARTVSTICWNGSTTERGNWSVLCAIAVGWPIGESDKLVAANWCGMIVRVVCSKDLRRFPFWWSSSSYTHHEYHHHNNLDHLSHDKHLDNHHHISW